MHAENFDIEALLKMAHSPVRNYVVPGLTSSLIGQSGPNGTVRLFQSERDQIESIAPHSHRFGFQCWVLRGMVRNWVWEQSYADHDPTCDEFMRSTLEWQGRIGQYVKREQSAGRWRYRERSYQAGQCYAMTAEEIHSIYFSRGAIVLFLEGPTERNWSDVLEPYVDREVIPTMEVRPWMFKREVD